MSGYSSGGIYFNEGGNPHGAPLVLVHGSGTNTNVFDRVFPLLAQFRVVAYDRRGYGRSKMLPPTSQAWTVQQADDLRAILEDLNAAPANILAWSAGGIYASVMAARHPKLVQRLLLYEPPLYRPSHITLPLVIGFSRLNAAKAAGNHFEAAKIFIEMVAGYEGGGNSFDDLPPGILQVLRQDAATLIEEINQIDNNAARNAIAALRVPITFLVGERSIGLFRNITADLLQTAQPNARVVTIAGGNHFAHVDRPADFANAVLAALRE